MVYENKLMIIPHNEVIGRKTRRFQEGAVAAEVQAASGRSATAGKRGCSQVHLDLSKVKVEPLFEDFVDFDTFSKSDFRVVKVKACEAVPKSKKLLKFTLMTAPTKTAPF